VHPAEWLPAITAERIGAAGDLATAATFVLALLIYASDRGGKRRAQAELVSAWFAYDAKREYFGDDDLWQLHVKNKSDRPVYGVLALPAQGVSEWADWTVLPPETEETIRVGSEIGDKLEGVTTGGGVIIDYTDASGRRWRRTADGRLHRWHRWLGRPSNPDLRRALRASRRGETAPEVEG